MKKYLVVLTMVLTLTLVAVTPAMAGVNQRRGGGHGKQQDFALVGTVTAIGNDTITVQAVNDRFAGQSITVKVTGDTRFVRWTPDGGVPATFDDLNMDDSVNVKGTIADGTFFASRVMMDVLLEHYP